MVNLAKKILTFVISLSLSTSLAGYQQCQKQNENPPAQTCQNAESCQKEESPKETLEIPCPDCETETPKENTPAQTAEDNSAVESKPQQNQYSFSDWIQSILQGYKNKETPSEESNGVTTTEKENNSQNETANEILRLVNIERAKVGLKPLRYCSEAQAAADLRAKEIKSVFSHTRPDGRSCFTVFEDFGIKGSYMCAENIACGYPSAQAVMDGWMNSPGHRANILSSNATALAVGINGNCYAQAFAHDYR